MDVDAQVVAESSRSGGRGRSSRLGVRHCGVCGNPGHNARTCQVVPESSGEEYASSLTTSETPALSTTSSIASSSQTASGSAAFSTDSTTTLFTTSTTLDATISSTVAPSSTTSIAPLHFKAIVQGGPAADTPARVPPPDYGSIFVGTYNPANVGAAVFSVEAGTGSLLSEGERICGFYAPGVESASLSTCNASPRSNEAPITCDQGQTDGGLLSCGAPRMTCIEDFNDDNDPQCYTTGGVWTQFWALGVTNGYYIVEIGSSNAASGGGRTAFDFVIQGV
ncbi:hypothetical protein NM208_g1250 [Fusarium decemcellulare]|uniref:Uncharacterized protein n=1 Tax=Fusarium decemcellulare TaxID=57161 RepID=A0ACC1SWJ3_9HYPO|nr:hypothetical protein NM208_g1250 [Fusarium decemcellulare]